ncbi:MAG: DUF559 domain-containing protein [Micromonosporaceae bacterium]
MNRELAALLARSGGVVAWRTALRHVPPYVVSYAVRAGHVVRLFPRVLVAAESVPDPWVRRRAALCSAGPVAALSHTSALAVWGLPADDADGVHVMSGPGRRLRAVGIVAHRRVGFGPGDVVHRSELPVTTLERALVDAWPVGRNAAQRAPLLTALSGRLTTPERVRDELDSTGNLPGRAALARLLDRLAAGCRSELELWGYDQVFAAPGLPAFRHQVPVRLGARTVYLDAYAEVERVNVELDGAAWHQAKPDRERDLRRDAALAALGIMVVRFSHDRLRYDTAAVVRDIRAILEARRRDIGLPPAS